MTPDEQLLADRQRLWHDFSRLLFWGALHAAVALIVVVMFAVNGPTVGTFILGLALIGGNIAITTGHFMSRRW
ncbi:hypothetical protein [Dongia sp.]|uniref:hypothetical protein n=1 Tax=Dongia sp. TaxID=1977262 RepID=UPI003753461A